MKSFCAAALMSLALAGSAHASVVGLFNTGADPSETSNAGSVDMHYSAVGAAGQPLVTFKDPAYASEVTSGSNQSLWLSTNPSGILGNINVLTSVFTVTGGSYEITGIWGVDNSGTLSVVDAISNVSQLVSTITYGFPAFQAPLTAFDFIVGPGTYQLAFALNNQEGPFALRVGELSVAAVPETSTWAMMIIGFCGLGFLAHRRRHRGAGPLVTA